ncbi:MAG: ammonium transporter [Treponema sp.]|jgi:Amt family ammonium transporter|nr:ammonium transporter [Treponema sp.]
MEKSAADLVWIIVGSGLVFMMQAGFAMVESGLTRSKNSINVAIKNLTDFGISTLCYWMIGFGLMFGASLAGLIGSGYFFLNPRGLWPAAFFLFQAMFCSTAATIVSGAVAERMRFSAYIASTIVLSAIIYPAAGHWIWGGGFEGHPSGWLAKLGFVDFAGSTAVHSVGGWISLVLLIVLGPRTGRFREDGSVITINGSSIPLAVLGVFLLWFGWIGFNGASTLAVGDNVPGIILRTMLGGSAGMIFSMVVGWPLYKKPEISLMLNGALAGLVAVTANCHATTETESVIIGGIGGLVTLGASRLLLRLRIDDAVDAIPVHLAAGIWGTLAVGIFGDPELLGTGLGRMQQTGIQVLGILSCGALCVAVGIPAMLLINRFIPLRINLQQEAGGLNKSEHGVTTEINDLFTVMDSHAKTGDISARAPVEPFTEAGQIAVLYNSVLDKLQDSTVEKGEYLNILANVKDGLFLLDKEWKIGPYHSASLERLFMREDIAGQNIKEIFNSFFDANTASAAHEFLDAAFDPSIAWRHLERLNPLRDVEAFFNDNAGGFIERNMEFSFARLGGPDTVDRLFVVVRDITEQKELAGEIEKTRNETREEMEMLQRILHVEPEVLLDFLESVRNDAEAINNELRSGSEDFSTRINTIFHYSHAVKGDAQLLSLDFLADRAEDMEQRIAELRGRDDISTEDFLPLTISCSELMQVIEKLETIINKWLKLSDSVRGGVAEKSHSLGDSLEAMARRLAEQYGKVIRLEMPGFKNIRLEGGMRKALRDIFVQLIRNSVYHGIEEPWKRRMLGKPECGNISITAEEVENPEGRNLRIVYRDDGGGIDKEKVRQKIRADGNVPGEGARALSEKDLIRYIFRAGFSTAEKADTVAGKGVGMGLVMTRVKELGGRLSVKSQPGLFCEFSLQFPLSGLADEKILPIKGTDEQF